MKLWIDDIRNPPDPTWHVARTVLSAIRFIKEQGPNTISLDHDISHQVTVGALGRPYPCEETFESVAHFICAMVEICRLNEEEMGIEAVWHPKITIHSSNPVGSKRMQNIFADKGIPVSYSPMGAANRLELEV